jgi:hypothetical protein
MSDDSTLPPPAHPDTSATQPDAQPGTQPGTVWWKKWWVITIAVVVMLSVIAGLTGGSDDAADATPPATTSDERADTTDTTEPAATTTDAPTTTVEATTTTTEPAPTTTAAPEPPFVIAGSGDAVQPFTIPGGDTIGIATISYDGSGNFAVWALDANLEQVDLLVNEIGSYQGTVLLPTEGSAALEITASGNWVVEVKQLAASQAWDGTVAGRGDNVLVYLGDTGIAAVTHNGESNFSMFSYPLTGNGFADLLVNEIGPYAGSVRFPGPALVEISADGDWAITVE